MSEAFDTTVHPSKISSDALDQLFREARTHSARLPKRVPVETLREAYELAHGSHQREFQSRPFCVSPKRSCKGKASARARFPQCRKDKNCAGHRDCRLGTPSSMRDFPSYFRTPRCAPISWETSR
jgi:hypothetical protein